MFICLRFSFGGCNLFFKIIFVGAAFSENKLCWDGLKFKLSITVSPRGPPKQGHCTVWVCVSMCMYHFAFQGEQTQECWVKNYFWGLFWILAWIRHRVTSVLTATDAKTPTDLSEESKVYGSVTENHGLSGTLPYIVFKHIFCSFSITDIADMWQGVIFIGREFLEEVSKVEKVWQIAEAGKELSHPLWKECLLYEKKKKRLKKFEERNISCKGLSALLHSTEPGCFTYSWRPVNTDNDPVSTF